ncbi:MAG TPA: peptidylprolyl isomerase [Tepidisphaeraceae bacterium]
MDRRLIAIAIVGSLLSSCAHEKNNPDVEIPATSQPTTLPTTQPLSKVIARVNGEPITQDELDKPLIEGYGLNVLLNLVQLDLARQQANRQQITITPEDIKKEQKLTVDKMFEGNAGPDADSLLDQFLQQQHISRPEFDLVIQTNAYLRKLVQPTVNKSITDNDLKLAFAAMYGETVKVRDIRLSNPQEVAEAKRRLASGETFEQVAREMSRDPITRPLGGELPPFSRQSVAVPQVFREAAFSLQPGQISDTIESDGAFHLIQLEQRTPPAGVKFETVKETVRKALIDQRTQLMMTQLRNQFRQTAFETLEIDDPILHQQFIHRINGQEGGTADKKQIEGEIKQDRSTSAEPPATMPSR